MPLTEELNSVKARRRRGRTRVWRQPKELRHPQETQFGQAMLTITNIHDRFFIYPFKHKSIEMGSKRIHCARKKTKWPYWRYLKNILIIIVLSVLEIYLMQYDIRQL